MILSRLLKAVPLKTRPPSTCLSLLRSSSQFRKYAKKAVKDKKHTNAQSVSSPILQIPQLDVNRKEEPSSKEKSGWDWRLLWQSSIYAAAIFGLVAIVKPDLLLMDYRKRDAYEKPDYASEKGLKLAIAKLREALPEDDQVDTDPDVIKEYGSSDYSYHPSSAHSVVVRPKTTEEVVQIVNISREHKVPITPYSGATSLEGQFSGNSAGSICVDLSEMNKILGIREQDSDLTCQAGAKWEDINATLKEKGIPLFFPLDPGPGATIGGMIGTGCSGTNAVRYGTAKGEWFLNITAVLPNGEVIQTRQRARKSSAGFDMGKLFIGAEGTLGIVTEATLRLAPVLPTKVAAASFPDVENAVSAVQEVLNSPYGSHVQCIELLDDNMMEAINVGGFAEKKWPIRDFLFFKIQGDDATINLTSKTIKDIVKRHKSETFEFAKTVEEAENMWQNRKYALMSTMALVPGSRCWTTDVCVPVSKLPQLVTETKRDLKEAGIKSTIIGHVGDGNFHALLLFTDDSELKAIHDAVHRMVHRALDLEGTCTGEHGVGIGKKEYLYKELGEGTVELMRTVKKAIDPLNLFNPGKLYPDKQSKEWKKGLQANVAEKVVRQ